MTEYSIRPPSYAGGSWTLVKHEIVSGQFTSHDYTSYPTLEHALVGAAQLAPYNKMVIPLMILP
jgi:hypothetical protein